MSACWLAGRDSRPRRRRGSSRGISPARRIWDFRCSISSRSGCFWSGMARRKPKVVHLITRLELGGAQQNTLYCAEHHDRDRFTIGLWAGAGGWLDARARLLPDVDVQILPWLVHPVSPMRDASAVL